MELGNFTDIQFLEGKPNMAEKGNSEHFSIKQIAIPKGTVIKPHPEDNATFFLVLKGRAIFTVDGKESELTQFDGILVPTNGSRGIKVLEDLIVVGTQNKAC
jgi:quercetin dioxygenase-like cupin family protein